MEPCYKFLNFCGDVVSIKMEIDFPGFSIAVTTSVSKYVSAFIPNFITIRPVVPDITFTHILQE